MSSHQTARSAGGPTNDPPHPGMVWIPGGTFRMGSENFYPEERPVHDVAVDGFWIDGYEVTNEQFERFVEATGYRTLAERPLNPADFPGAPVENLVPGSMVFQKTTGPVDLRNYENWWAWVPGASWRHPKDPAAHSGDLESPGGPRGLRRCRSLRAMGREGVADRARMGAGRPRGTGRCGIHVGR